jgi:geranylgeranyl diphosphate synthase, type I
MTMVDIAGLVTEFVEPAVRAAVSGLSQPIRDVASYHFGWCDMNGTPTRQPVGKKLRPALTLAVADALGGSPRDAVPGAVAIDLVHNQSLIHDDIIDGDVIRRHRPAVWAAFGSPTAILVGDAVLTLGFQAVSGGHSAVRAAQQLAACFQYMLYGQMLDTALERRTEVSTADYVEMATAKTGSLFGCAAGLGALYSGTSDETVARFDTFGRSLGLAFQLVDDILGIWGNQATLGKSVTTDVLRRKKTGPVVAALCADSTDAQRLRALYMRPEPFVEDEVPDIANLIERAGGRCWAQHAAERHMATALDQLAQLPLVAQERRALDDLVSSDAFSIRRTW